MTETRILEFDLYFQIAKSAFSLQCFACYENKLLFENELHPKTETETETTTMELQFQLLHGDGIR
jgi:hypothetical protein